MDNLPCTLVIPAAGDSERFKTKSTVPKPLIRFVWRGRRKSMLEHVIPRNWNDPVLVGCKKESHWNFFETLKDISNVRLLPMAPTSGQAETVYLMLKYGNISDDVIVLNCDNAFDEPVLDEFLERCRDRPHLRCGALTFRPSLSSDHKRYGYVNSHPTFEYGAEKDPISSHALAGAFYFRDAEEYCEAYEAAEVSRTPLYISELFEHIPGRDKLSVDVLPRYLHEWGTPESLESDPSVIVDWSSIT